MKKLIIFLALMLISSPVFAANRYWVGGGSSTNWNATGNTNWSATSGGANNASVPGSSDAVFFDAASGSGTANISASITVGSIDCTGFTGTWTQADSTNLSVAGTLKLVSGMTYSPSADTQAIIFTGTGDFYSGTKQIGNLTVNGSGITTTLQDTLTMRAATTTFTLAQGTFTTNNNTITAGIFSLGTTGNTRVLNLGSSTINITGAGSVWTISNGTGITINSGTSTIILNGAGVTMSSRSYTYYTVRLIGSGTATLAGSGTSTFTNLERTGTAVKTDSLAISTPIVVTGVLKLYGNSSVNRLWVRGGTLGTVSNITNTGATMDWQNVDFREISLGTAYDCSAITGLCGDVGGNSNITFTTGNTYYWFKNAGNWSDSTKWFTATNGGGSAGRVPLAQDSVIFDANSFDTASQTVTQDMPIIGSWNAYNIDSSPTFSVLSGTLINGSLLLPNAGLTWSCPAITFVGRGSYQFSPTAAAMVTNLTLSAPGGTLTWINRNSYLSQLVVSAGTFDLNDYSVSITSGISSGGVLTRAIYLGNGQLSVTYNGTLINFTSTGLSFNAENSTVLVTNQDTGAKTLNLADQTFNILRFANSATVNVQNTITGSNNITNLIIGYNNTLKFTAGTTQTIGSLSVLSGGSISNRVTLSSATPGSVFTMTDSDGTNTCTYCTIQDSTVTGGATWDAPLSRNVSNNTGWNFYGNSQLRGQTKIGSGRIK